MSVKHLRAGDITRPVVTATRRASARHVALQLLNGLYSGIPIADETGRVVGMVTELDLLKAAEKGADLLETTTFLRTATLSSHRLRFKVLDAALRRRWYLGASASAAISTVIR
jgi:CBS-domain-containing membrane protein